LTLQTSFLNLASRFGKEILAAIAIVVVIGDMPIVNMLGLSTIWTVRLFRDNFWNRLCWYHPHVNCYLADLQTDGSKWHPSKEMRAIGRLGCKFNRDIL
jgi:hypothetical protein